MGRESARYIVSGARFFICWASSFSKNSLVTSMFVQVGNSGCSGMASVDL